MRKFETKRKEKKSVQLEKTVAGFIKEVVRALKVVV